MPHPDFPRSQLVQLRFNPAADHRDDDSQPFADPPTATGLDLVEQLVTLCGATHRRTRSRKHGHQPNAAAHVRDWAYYHLGESVAEMARESGRNRATVYRSIDRGAKLVQDKCNPDRPPAAKPNPGTRR